MESKHAGVRVGTQERNSVGSENASRALTEHVRHTAGTCEADCQKSARGSAQRVQGGKFAVHSTGTPVHHTIIVLSAAKREVLHGIFCRQLTKPAPLVPKLKTLHPLSWTLSSTGAKLWYVTCQTLQVRSQNHNILLLYCSCSCGCFCLNMLRYGMLVSASDNSLYAALDSLLAAMSLSWTAESGVPGAAIEEQKLVIIRVYLQQQVGHTCLALIELGDRNAR